MLFSNNFCPITLKLPKFNYFIALNRVTIDFCIFLASKNISPSFNGILKPPWLIQTTIVYTNTYTLQCTTSYHEFSLQLYTHTIPPQLTHPKLKNKKNNPLSPLTTPLHHPPNRTLTHTHTHPHNRQQKASARDVGERQQSPAKKLRLRARDYSVQRTRNLLQPRAVHTAAAAARVFCTAPIHTRATWRKFRRSELLLYCRIIHTHTHARKRASRVCERARLSVSQSRKSNSAVGGGSGLVLLLPSVLGILYTADRL